MGYGSKVDSTCTAPPRDGNARLRAQPAMRHVKLPQALVVAAQVEFERKMLKPVFHFMGYRLLI
jgi:hypothetical protein